MARRSFGIAVATGTWLLIGVGVASAATITLDPAKASRDPVWKQESFANNAWTIHSPETLYKITTAKMVWSSFPGSSGSYALRIKCFAKSNGSAPIWVKVNGTEVWKGVTPLPYNLTRPYCCGAKNSRDCALKLGTGETVWINTGKKVTISKGAAIEFWGKTAYYCQPSGWTSGQSLTGYGGGTYSSIFVMEWVGDGGTTDAIVAKQSNPAPKRGISVATRITDRIDHKSVGALYSIRGDLLWSASSGKPFPDQKVRSIPCAVILKYAN